MEPERILAAEDSPTQAAVLRAQLEAAGFQVSLARDGAEAIALLDAEPFDIVVSDVVMPDVDGYELCHAVKGRFPSMPVMLLTSLKDPLDVVSALTAGADNFLRKPYEHDELVHRIRNLLYNKRLRDSGRTQIGLELFFLGRRFMINADREQILDLLISTFEDLVVVNEQLRAREEALASAKDELAVRLAETEIERERLDAVLAAMPGGMVVIDTDGRVVNANDHFARLLDSPLPDLRGAVLWDAMRFVDFAGAPIEADQHALYLAARGGEATAQGSAFDLFLERGDGGRLPVVAKSAPVRNGGGHVVGAVGTLEDLRMLMDHDPVTGLPGHGALIDRLTAAIHPAKAHDTDTAVVVATIDRLERIHQSMPGPGSAVVVAAVSGRARTALRSPELEARAPGASAVYLGNGDLAVVLPEVDGKSDAFAVAQLLVEQLSGQVRVAAVDVDVSVSAAIGMCGDEPDAVRLVAQVAAAARAASREGGQRVASSDDALQAHVTDLLRRESELRTAIETDQLVVEYQPQVNVFDGSPVGVEALVRWQHPTLGMLGAEAIVPLAIDSGLICALGWWVLERACRQGSEWHRDLPHGEDMLLSVNVAAEQLSQSDAVERIAGVLESTGFDPTALVLEITEGSVMEASSHVQERLRDIKALGVELAVDDFGTGYSSLLQVRQLPVDILKIDRAFIAGMLDEPADAAIVTSVVRLARSLGLGVVAEGVEHVDQLVQLRLLGCDFAQGYHWARPMPREDLADWWTEHAAVATSDRPPGAGGAEIDGEHDEAISYIVHELRSPLAAIKMTAGALRGDVGAALVADDGAQLVDIIVRNAQELDNRLVSLAEANDVFRGGFVLHTEDHDVTELVERIGADVSPQLRAHTVEIAGAEGTIASVDPARLHQAVSNLLTNAAKFGPEGTPIEVSVTSTDTVVVIAVRDHGPGIPPHRRPELFRRFSRLGSTGEGMGLGLYLCRLIVEAHGGVLRYDDAPGGGAIFSIRLPRRSSGQRHQ